MANPWFRMYAEFATDPKVQMLSEIDQRRLTMIFCLRCMDKKTLTDDEICFQLRISVDEWVKSKEKFISKNFIDSNNQVLNWDKRQFVNGGNGDPLSKSSNYVYIVADRSKLVAENSYYVVKIGISKNPWARVKELQTGNENKIEILATFRADIVSDAEIHSILDAYRHNGEWFKLPTGLVLQLIEHSKEKESNYESARSLIVALLRSNTTVATKTTTEQNRTEHIQNKSITPLAMLMAMGVSESLAKDYIKVRKEKKSALTQTALDLIAKEAFAHDLTFEQAIKICTENSWVGFKYSWIKDLPTEKTKGIPEWAKGAIGS